MALPYLPLFVTDFEADTAHLTLVEDGAYNRLLRLCWRTPGCSVPDDDDWIRRRLRVSETEYDQHVRPVIDEFFERKRGRVLSARLLREFERAVATHSARKKAGEKGGRARKSLITGDQSESRAKAKTNQTASKTEASIPKPISKEKDPSDPKKKSGSKGTRLSDDWVLPDDWARWAIEDQGVTPAFVRAEAEQFRDYWLSVAGQKGVKANWLATWRNWIRRAAKRHPASRGPAAVGGQQTFHGLGVDQDAPVQPLPAGGL